MDARTYTFRVGKTTAKTTHARNGARVGQAGGASTLLEQRPMRYLMLI